MRERPARAPSAVGSQAPVGQRAIVVFEDRADIPSLAWLRPGFRHCFCLLDRPVGWVLCDPLKASTRLEVIAPYDEAELLAHFRSAGMTPIAGCCLPASLRGSPLRPLTCVEVVKRIVGLSAIAVWTPHQLYKALLLRGFREAGAGIDRGIDNIPMMPHVRGG